MKRGNLAFFLVAFSILGGIVLWFLWMTGAASAETIDTSSTSSAANTAMEQKILHWPDVGTGDEPLTAGMMEAAEGGGVEAAVGGSVLLTGATIASGSYIVYRVADGFGLGNYVYRKLWGGSMPNPGAASPVVVGGPSWRWCGIPHSSSCSSYAGYQTAGWILWILSNCSSGGCVQSPTANHQEDWCSTSGGAFNGYLNTLRTAFLQAGGVTHNDGRSGADCSSGPEVVTSAGAGSSVAAEDNSLFANSFGARVEPATATDYNNAPSGQQATSTGTEGTSCNLTCLQNACLAINCNNASAQTTRQAKAVKTIADAGKGADPSTPGITGSSIQVLAPMPNEIYQDYLSRLRNEGYLGTATTTAETTALVGYGPNAPTRISIPDGVGGTQTLDPLNWPVTLPIIAPNDAITIRYNPATATPAPTTQPSGNAVCGTLALGACQVQDTSTGPDNAVGTIDWTPIESINFGSKFPFGIPGYVNSFFSAIPTGGSCPTLNIGKPAILGGGTLGISFCNTDWETIYRSPVFLVLEALMTLAGVLFLANKIFGIGSSDD